MVILLMSWERLVPSLSARLNAKGAEKTPIPGVKRPWQRPTLVSFDLEKKKTAGLLYGLDSFAIHHEMCLLQGFAFPIGKPLSRTFRTCHEF